MTRKGLTIIEVIIALAFLGLISMIFLPALTGSILNTQDASKYTVAAFLGQKEIENDILQIGSLLENHPIGDLDYKNQIVEKVSLNAFGKSIDIHKYSLNLGDENTSHGKINILLTKTKPELITPAVKNVHFLITGVAGDQIDLASDNIDNIKLTIKGTIAEENDRDLEGNLIDQETRNSYGLTVASWYLSKTPTSYNEKPETIEDFHKDFDLFREWNTERDPVDFGQHPVMNIIKPANRGKDIDLNNDNEQEVWNEIRLNLVTNEDDSKLSIEKMDEIYGDRWLMASITPYQVTAGRSGIEVPALTNISAWPRRKLNEVEVNSLKIAPIFIKGLSLEVESANYLVDLLEDGSLRKNPSNNTVANKFLVKFKKEISQAVNDLNLEDKDIRILGREVKKIYPGPDSQSLIFTFEDYYETERSISNIGIEKGIIKLANGREPEIKPFNLLGNNIVYSFYKLDSQDSYKFETREEIRDTTTIRSPKYNPLTIKNLRDENFTLSLEGDLLTIKENPDLNRRLVQTRNDIDLLKWNIAYIDGRYFLAPAVVIDDDNTELNFAINFQDSSIYLEESDKIALESKYLFELIVNNDASFSIKLIKNSIDKYLSIDNLQENSNVILNNRNNTNNTKWIFKTIE